MLDAQAQAQYPEEDENQVIAMKHLVIPFFILCIGLVLSVISFLLEITIKKRNSSIQTEEESGTQNQPLHQDIEIVKPVQQGMISERP